jgi:hypothetical protein
MGIEMNNDRSHRRALLGLLVVWCAYVAFALATDWEDLGFAPLWPVDAGKYTVARISVVSLWSLVAAVLLRFRHRDDPINWRSFSYSFAGVVITSLVLWDYLVPGGASLAAVAGTVVFYALVAGFLCATLSKPVVAALLGPLLFAAQWLGDVLLHMLTGVLRLH